jgi:hypothetical protein
MLSTKNLTKYCGLFYFSCSTGQLEEMAAPSMKAEHTCFFKGTSYLDKDGILSALADMTALYLEKEGEGAS